jgi:pimeloyl-ACP methyl ester carboxylesterase
MQVAVDCAEETPFVTTEDVSNGSREVPEEIVAADIGFSNPAALKAERDRCSTFGVTALGSIEEQAVVSDVPTLVLGGEYDPITPPKYGRLAAQTLSRSSFFEFKGTGHGVIYARECGMRMAAAFIASPEAQVDGSCVGEIGPPLFQVQ